MPSLTLSGQEISPKRLARHLDRSRKLVSYHSATFHGESLPRIRKLALSIYRDAISTSDKKLKIKLARQFAELVELRRCLLGFPGPGKRKDEPEKIAKSSNPVVYTIDPEKTAPFTMNEDKGNDPDPALSSQIAPREAIKSESVSTDLSKP